MCVLCAHLHVLLVHVIFFLFLPVSQLVFPSVMSDHWFVFMVDFISRNFIFLDSVFGEDSSYHNYVWKKMVSFLFYFFIWTWTWLTFCCFGSPNRWTAHFCCLLFCSWYFVNHFFFFHRSQISLKHGTRRNRNTSTFKTLGGCTRMYQSRNQGIFLNILFGIEFIFICFLVIL